MYKLGITGGIVSGKSTAADFFKKNGAEVFNADREAKKHLKHTKILQNRIIGAFGQKIVENNKLSIKKLAEVAFSSKIEQNILNGLMWPEVFILVEKAIQDAKEKGDKILCVADSNVAADKLEEELMKELKPKWHENKYLWFGMGIVTMIVPIWVIGQIK